VKAVLLAAGKGTRLAPLTNSKPKILVPVDGSPLLEYQLKYLAANGVREVAVNVHHHAQQVVDFLAGNDLGVSTRVSVESDLLGTAGALVPLAEFLDDDFIVLYGDVMTDSDLGDLMRHHRASGAIATLAYYRSQDTLEKGLLELGDDERVRSFVEKPADGSAEGLVNAGIYALSPEILSFIPLGFADFGHDVWPAVLAAGRPLHGYEVEGYVVDVGSPEALELARERLGRVGGAAG
jgi:NDP-sugar pyrophosphorylase family protein